MYTHNIYIYIYIYIVASPTPAGHATGGRAPALPVKHSYSMNHMLSGI